MDLLQLRMLREVARCGSISAAAEALDYTQPAISRQLAALERSAGRPLVERTGRGTRLTPVGEILLRRAETILTELDGARADLSQLEEHSERPLRLVAFATALASFVPDAVADVRRRAPEVQIEVRFGQAQIGDASLGGDRLDVALANANARAFSEIRSDVRVVPVRRDPMWCCLPVGHPLAERDVVPIAALRGERMILTATTLCADRELLLDACAGAGFSPRVAGHSDDYATTQGMVAVGIGVAALPEMGLPTVRADVVLRPFAVPIQREVVALVPRDAPPRPERDLLVAALVRTGAAWTGAAPQRAPVRSSQALKGSPVIRS